MDIYFKSIHNGNFQEGPLYILYVFINDLYFMVGAYQAYVYSRKAKNYQQKKSYQILGIYMAVYDDWHNARFFSPGSYLLCRN